VIDRCLDHIEHVSFMVASHNEASNLHLAHRVKQLNLDFKHPHIECAQLYGMGDHITFNMAEAGFNASKYIPYGPVDEVIPYLIRRAKENMSVEGQMSRELQLLQQELRRRSL
jgi:proline dehydrogenase